MARKRSIWLAAVAVAALVGALGVPGASAAPPVATDASGVIHWNRVAANTLAAIPGPNGGAPPRSRSTWAWCRAPSTTPSTRSGPRNIGRTCSTGVPGEGVDRRRRRNSRVRRAHPARLHRTGASSIPRSPRLLTTLATELGASLDAIEDGSFKRQGIEVGLAAAWAMLDARRNDGRFGPSQWVPNTAAGHWWPLSMRPGSSSIRRPGPAG